jgi:hypothetical protein
MKRYIVTVRNRTGNAPIGFEGVWIEAENFYHAKARALGDVSEIMGVETNQLICTIEEKT